MTGLSKEDYKLFVEDALQNCIVVGGACKSACVFCSCAAQAAAGLRNWTSYISTEDLDSVVQYIDPRQTIYFGEGVAFLSCEPFQHPDYLELLERLERYFPDTPKRTTTNCKHIDPKDYDRLKKAKMTFVAGINTLDREKRGELMRSPDNYDGVISFLTECAEEVDKVSLLYTGDLDVLQRDLDLLHSISERYRDVRTMLRLIDYSSYHDAAAKALHIETKKTWHQAIERFEQRVEYPQYWIRSLVDFPDNTKRWDDEQGLNIHAAREAFESKVQRALELYAAEVESSKIGFLLAQSVYEYFTVQYPELAHLAIEVPNVSFGGSYVVAPLLSRRDILEAIGQHERYESYLAPREMFPRFNKDILGHHLAWDYSPLDIKLV